MKRVLSLIFMIVFLCPLFAQSDNDLRYDNPRSPVVAGTLSLFLPGLGQFYNKQPEKGYLILGANVFGGGLAALGVVSQTVSNANAGFVLAVTGLSIMAGTTIVSTIDAVSSAAKINKRYQLSLSMSCGNLNPNSLQISIRIGCRSTHHSPLTTHSTLTNGSPQPENFKTIFPESVYLI